MKTSALYCYCLFLVFALFGQEADYEEISSREETEEPPRPADYSDLINLESMAQDFVLETKQIHIPGYPDAFNPSIVRWQGRLLMSCRTYHPESRATNEIILIYLDENCNPASAPIPLRFPYPDPFCLNKRQDPRLLVIGEQLWVVYNNAIEKEVRRMLVGAVSADCNSFSIEHVECLYTFDGETPLRSEKNWVPFDYEGHLHLAYSIVPHRILRPLFGMNACTTLAATLGSIKWDWGVLRGGTPALLEGDEYLAFFHCCKSMATVHSKGESIPHYFMGAYTFSAAPPFELTRISSAPIIGKQFYEGATHKTWKPLHVVFPGGYISDEHYIWIAYGRQDHEIWIAKLNKNALLKGLVPVAYKK
ncbi:MAG: hypothetical protein HY861_01905 [Chlamydiia bacterium]|nr:hypothetical protein [Chlamydiia bacterium]